MNNTNISASNPVPLGLACFAVSVFILSGYLWGFLQGQDVVTTAFFVGGVGMLYAAVGAYRRRDTLEATWMGAYSAFWAALAFYLWFFAPTSVNLTVHLAWLGFAWGILTAYFFIMSLRAKAPLVSLQLLLFFILFLFVWIGNAFHVQAGNKVAAIAGVLSAIVAAAESCIILSSASTDEAPQLTRPGHSIGGPMGASHAM